MNHFTRILFTSIKVVLYSDYSDALNFWLFTVTRNSALSNKRDMFITEYKRIAMESYSHKKYLWVFNDKIKQQKGEGSINAKVDLDYFITSIVRCSKNQNRSLFLI